MINHILLLLLRTFLNNSSPQINELNYFHSYKVKRYKSYRTQILKK